MEKTACYSESEKGMDNRSLPPVVPHLKTNSPLKKLVHEFDYAYQHASPT